MQVSFPLEVRKSKGFAQTWVEQLVCSMSFSAHDHGDLILNHSQSYRQLKRGYKLGLLHPLFLFTFLQLCRNLCLCKKQRTHAFAVRFSNVTLFWIWRSTPGKANRLVRKLVEICCKNSFACMWQIQDVLPGRNPSPNSSSMLAVYLLLYVYKVYVGARRLRFGESTKFGAICCCYYGK